MLNVTLLYLEALEFSPRSLAISASAGISYLVQIL